MVSGNFGELHSGDGARGARPGEDDLSSLGKQDACNFVDSFIAQGSINDEEPAAGKIVAPKRGKLAGCPRIVRAIEVNVGMRSQFFEAPWPGCHRDAPLNSFIGNVKAAIPQDSRRGNRVERILQLKASG